jgi:ATP-binding cassette subfamily A (ABC1) protein 3
VQLAVEGMNFFMREGEIFCLLGHNGAGKTTTINCLTGLLDITSGDCSIYGRSIRTDALEIRRSIGFCPQHNVLYEDLTVEEHLQLFAKMKGYTGEELAKEVNDMIAAVDLEAKRHSFASQLSGGMKRKLSIGIAYIGGSKLIILDEPTAGMDPVSRQKIWALIQKFKSGRVTLLTTHFLDEADVLGDRIGIVNNGRMRCSGTSLFLKNRFGLGYQINMVRSSACSLPALEAHITSHVPPAQLLSQSGLELSYRLPFSCVSSFPALLRSLDAKGSELGVDSYGLGVTTLEEVFLSVTKDSAEFKKPVDAEAEMQLVSSGNVAAVSKAEPEALGPPATPATATETASLSNFHASVYDHVSVLVTKRTIQSLRSPRSLFCNMLFPIFLAIVGGLLTKAPIASIRQPSIYLHPTIVFKPSSFVLVNTATLADTNRPSLSCSAPSTPPLTLAFPPQAGVTVSAVGSSSSGSSGIDSMQAKLYENALRDGQDFDLASPFAVTYVCNGTKQGMVLWNNRKVQHALPAALATLHNSLPAFAANPPVQFHVNNFPIEYKISRPANNVAGYIIVLMVAMSFAPGFPAYVAVQERVTKSRHLLRVMGMRPSVYWCTYYGFDLLWQCVSALVHLSAFSHVSFSFAPGTHLSSPLLSSPSLSRSTASLTAPSTRCACFSASRPPTTSCSCTFSPFL